MNGASRAQWQRAFSLLLAAGVAVYFLWAVRSILPPFFIAFFLAALLDPIATRLQRKGVSRGRSVLTIYALVFLLFVLVIVLVLPPAMRQVESLTANYSSFSANLTARLSDLYERNHGLLNSLGIKSNPFRPQEGLQEQQTSVSKAVAIMLDTVKGAAVGIAGKAIWLIIIPLALFYFLMDFQALRARIIYLLPARHQEQVAHMSEEIVEIFGAYFRSLAIVCALYGITASVLFTLLGIPYSLFLGLAAGVLYAVPYAGPAITATSVVILALTRNPWIVSSPLGYAVLCVAVFLVMHVSFDYGVTPRVVGGSVGLHPIVNIFALMCGATLFGVWGMLLAVPVGASIQMLLVYFFPRLSQKPGPVPVSTAPAPDEVAAC